MKKFLTFLLILAIAIAVGIFAFTLPTPVEAGRFADLTGDPENGETVYYAAGCASCHMAPESEDALSLPGGQRFETQFGTFIAPNISTDATHGIGGWTVEQFGSAVLEGVSPDGAHLYPSFPYTTYARMTDGDLVDLWAFMQTLPAAERADEPHELGFPFNVRLSLGPWKTLYVTEGWAVQTDDPLVERGRYLAEALGHCAECHTPRNALGAPQRDRWMAGAPNPSGEGRIPGITPAQLSWSAGDIAYYLQSGLTPEFDSAGGEMAAVIRNTSKLSDEDREALAAYVKALKPVE